MGSADIFILGQKYTVKGDSPDEHIRQLAGYVNDRIKEVCERLPNVTPLKATILAAITIADELHRLREEEADITRRIEEKATVLKQLFD